MSWNPHPNPQPDSRIAPGAPLRVLVAFAPDGRTLATARGTEIRVWSLDPSGPPPEAAPRGQIEKLQGTWNSMSVTGLQTRVTIEGTHFSLRRIPKGAGARAEEPKPELFGEMLDTTTGDPPARFRIEESKVSTPLVGIYRVEGDTLFLCLRKGEKGQEYPTNFATNPATGDELFVLKKAVVKPDAELILGTWRGVAAEIDGKPVPQHFVDLMKPTVTFTPDKIVGKPAGTVPKAFLDLGVAQGMLPRETAAIVETGVEGVYHLDPAKSPREIDFTILGEVKKTALGIYQLDGDALKLCLSIDPAKVSERPTEFAAKAGDKRVVLTLRRLTREEVILEDVERRIDPARTDGKTLPVALLEDHGVAALRFGKWRLLFEGVPCHSHGLVVFGVRFFFLPEAGGQPVVGPPRFEVPAPALRQQWNGRKNIVALETYQFAMEQRGTRLVFADKTYEATDQVQTIMIARDGTTRIEAPKK